MYYKKQDDLLGINMEKFIFAKCDFDELQESIRKYDLELSWELIDRNYVWKNNCYLFRIEDKYGEVYAFMYYNIRSGKCHIDQFEVLKSKRDKGNGRRIILQFMNDRNYCSEDIILLPIDEDSQKFWNQLGIKCSLY